MGRLVSACDEDGKCMESMEKARDYLRIPEDEAEAVSRLAVPAHRAGDYPSYYQSFALRGVRIDRVEPGLVVCSFSVPDRLTDRSGNLATGAIVNLVDEIGYAVLHKEGVPLGISVHMSISYLSTAKAGVELEITSRALGKRGAYSGSVVLIRNKATRELVAEGRQSLFSPRASKL